MNALILACLACLASNDAVDDAGPGGDEWSTGRALSGVSVDGEVCIALANGFVLVRGAGGVVLVRGAGTVGFPIGAKSLSEISLSPCE